MASMKKGALSSTTIIAPMQMVLQAVAQEFVSSCGLPGKCSFSQQEPIDDPALSIKSDSEQSTCISLAAAVAVNPFENWPNAITIAATATMMKRAVIMDLNQFTMLHSMSLQTRESI